MPFRPLAGCAARWIIYDAENVARIVEEILREEAWWAAARTCKYAQRDIVWADRPAPPCEGYCPRIAP